MSAKKYNHILLVEDDEDLRAQMASIMEDEGYRVERAVNGRAALDYLLNLKREDYPGCIVLDLMMPVMTGGEFLKTVLGQHADTLGRIPVIVATAKGSPKEELAGLPSHVARIRKPMDIDEFLSVISESCGPPA